MKIVIYFLLKIINYDSFDDFNNQKIKLEKNELIGFNAKAKECNMLYELNNNG